LPGCGQPTSGPRSDPDDVINIGVAAHITAASEGGPRFDKHLSKEQRQAIANGIWLCQNCAKTIDNDATHYTVGLLHDWKRVAEEKARAAIDSPGQSLAFNLESPRQAVEQELRSFRHLLQAASQTMLGWPATLTDGQRIEPDVQEKIRLRFETEKASTTLVLGPKRTGKSALLSVLGREAIKLGIATFAIKADAIPASVTRHKSG
jgi:hypothetical protein